MAKSATLACWTALGLCWAVAVNAPAFAGITVDHPGTEVATKAFNCGGDQGTISIKTGVGYKIDTPIDEKTHFKADAANGISVRAASPKCNRCTWVQFVWREILDSAGAPLKDSLGRPFTFTTPSGGTYQSTSDPTNPNYAVDTSQKTTPSYPSESIETSADPANTLFDSPTGGKRPDPKAASEVAHYNLFFVCSGKVCFKVIWSKKFTWDATGNVVGGKDGGTYSTPVVNTSGEPPNAAQMGVLNHDYPGQTVIK